MKKITGSKLKKFNKQNKLDTELVFVLDNLEYARNVASIFNLAFALKVENIYLTGITTSPPFGKELQKVSKKREDQIHWKKINDLSKVINKFKSEGTVTLAIAKTDESTDYREINFNTQSKKVAIIVGNEKQGISNKLLSTVDIVSYVPVFRPLAHLNIVNELAVFAYNLV